MVTAERTFSLEPTRESGIETTWQDRQLIAQLMDMRQGEYLVVVDTVTRTERVWADWGRRFEAATKTAVAELGYGSAR